MSKYFRQQYEHVFAARCHINIGGENEMGIQGESIKNETVRAHMRSSSIFFLVIFVLSFSSPKEFFSKLMSVLCIKKTFTYLLPKGLSLEHPHLHPFFLPQKLMQLVHRSFFNFSAN